MAEAWIAALAGAACGVLIGLAARLGRFCSLGAIEDVVYVGSSLRARQWLVAMGTACLGTTALIASGHLDPDLTLYAGARWHPATVLLGGLLFGYGMAITGTCAFGALARLGGGDIRGFVVSVMVGLAAFATISGPLAWPRLTALPAPRAFEDIPATLSAATGLPAEALALAIAVALLAAGLHRMPPGPALWGALAGAAIPLGWAATSHIGRTGFDELAVRSLSFARPSGETLLWTMTSTAGGPGFGVGSVAGVVAGALLGSLWRREFRWEACDDPRELRRQVAGSALMGVGAVLALGCTVGQGLSSVSVLSWSAPVTIAGIVGGATLGLRQMVEGFSS